MLHDDGRRLDALIEELTIDADNDEQQLGGFLVGAEEALVRGERATIVGATVELINVECGPDARTGLTARVLHRALRSFARTDYGAHRRARPLTADEFTEHFGQLAADGEG